MIQNDLRGGMMDVNLKQRVSSLFSPYYFFPKLWSVAMESSDPLDLTLLLAAILHRAEKWVRTEHGYLCLVNTTHNKLEIVYGTGLAAPYNDGLLERGEGLAGKVWETGQVLHIKDYGQWSGRASPERTQNRPTATAAIGVPIWVGGTVVGVIGLFFAEQERQFTPDEIEFFTRIGETAGTVLANATLATPDEMPRYITAFNEAIPDPSTPSD